MQSIHSLTDDDIYMHTYTIIIVIMQS